MRSGREDALSLSEIHSSAKIPGRGDAGSEPTPCPGRGISSPGKRELSGMYGAVGFFFLSRKCLVSGLIQEAPPPSIPLGEGPS